MTSYLFPLSTNDFRKLSSENKEMYLYYVKSLHQAAGEKHGFEEYARIQAELKIGTRKELGFTEWKAAKEKATKEYLSNSEEYKELCFIVESHYDRLKRIANTLKGGKKQ